MFARVTTVQRGDRTYQYLQILEAYLAEVSIHPHALGCQTHPVGYLEGWWVEPDLRRTGLGRQLVAAAENWARARVRGSASPGGTTHITGSGKH